MPRVDQRFRLPNTLINQETPETYPTVRKHSVGNAFPYNAISKRHCPYNQLNVFKHNHARVTNYSCNQCSYQCYCNKLPTWFSNERFRPMSTVTGSCCGIFCTRDIRIPTLYRLAKVNNFCVKNFGNGIPKKSASPKNNYLQKKNFVNNYFIIIHLESTDSCRSLYQE